MKRSGLCVLLVSTLVVFGCSDEESNESSSATSGPGSGSGGTGATGGVGPGGGAAGGSGATGGSGGSGGVPVPQNQFLYVSNQNDDNVAVYRIGDAGGLTLVENEDVTGGPGPLAVTPDESRLYVASVSGRSVSAFDIDPATGALTAIGGAVSINPSPVYIAVDQTASYLLLASYGGNVAQSYALMGDGTLNGTPISDHAGPGNNAHAIVLSPSNTHVFVPNTNPAPETISQLVFDPTDGTLTDNPTAATVDASGAQAVGPRHLTFHPSLDLVYVVNEHSDSVTVYDYAPTTGTLTEGATTSTLPGGAPDGGNTCADIHITPDGSALYASNRGDDSIAMFSVDDSGALTVLGHVDTEATPREFEVTRDGRFVYVAGQDSDMLAAYQVGSTGTLTPLTPATYAVGDRPMWVLAISVDQP